MAVATLATSWYVDERGNWEQTDASNWRQVDGVHLRVYDLIEPTTG